jgi:hypothetical protein
MGFLAWADVVFSTITMAGTLTAVVFGGERVTRHRRIASRRRPWRWADRELASAQG